MNHSLWERTTPYRCPTENVPVLSSKQSVLESLFQSKDNIENWLQSQSDFYYLEQLSGIRHNLLDWISFDNIKNVLELDGGSGAVTSLLCRRALQVTTVVSDEKDCYLNCLRNHSFDNLSIRQCSHSTPDSETTVFDTVTITGLRAAFFDSLFPDHSDDFDPAERTGMLLTLAHDALNSDGKLILSLNNRLGIRYWAGMQDGCSIKMFDSICGHVSSQEEYTFSKNMVKSLLENNGFTDINFYYPVPDYRFPTEIFSDRHLPKPGDVRPVSVNYDRECYQLFDQKSVMDSLCSDGLFDQFTNSFLIICRKRT